MYQGFFINCNFYISNITSSIIFCTVSIVFKFNDSEDTNSNIITELKSLVVNYKSKLISTLGENIKNDDIVEPTPNNPIIPEITDTITHNFTTNGLNSNTISNVSADPPRRKANQQSDL